MENGAAADCGYGRKLADDEAVAGQDHDIVLQAELRESGLSRGEFFLSDENQFRDSLARAAMKVDTAALLHFWRRAQKLQLDVDSSCYAEFPGGSKHHAATHRGVFDTGKIYGGSLSCRTHHPPLSAH